MPSGGRGIFQRQAGEETEFDQLGTERVLLGQLLEGLVENGEVVGGFRDGEIDLVEAEVSPVAAPLESALVAGAVDQNAAHGLGDSGKEVSAAVPVLDLLLSHQAQVRFVD